MRIFLMPCARLSLLFLSLRIDAICKARGRGGDSTGVHDTVVNQLLSKIDGVNALNNILVIGMTNRKDMIDPALLRPGRLEVHIEIGLPDEKGRNQIFGIHLKNMKDNGMLGDDVHSQELAALTKNFSGAEVRKEKEEHTHSRPPSLSTLLTNSCLSLSLFSCCFFSSSLLCVPFPTGPTD